jgi:PEP-CTERM motif
MKKLLLIMFCMTLVLPIVCSADTIVSRAGLTYTCVGTCAPGGLTVVTTPNSAWATIPGASWISYTSNTSGQGAYTPTANGTVMTVMDTFNATAGTTVNIHVLADDTTGVLITPGFAFPAVTGPPGTFHTCAPTEIGCLTSTEGNFSFIAPTTGVYTAVFDVRQVAGFGFGLDYSISAISTPEPASLALLGSGLLAAAGFMRRRTKR